MCERAQLFAGRRRRRRRSACVYANAEGVALIHSGKTRAAYSFEINISPQPLNPLVI